MSGGIVFMTNYIDKSYPSNTKTKENYIETKLINDHADIMCSFMTDGVPIDNKSYGIGILVLNKNVQLLRKQVQYLTQKIAETNGDKFPYTDKDGDTVILKDKRILKKRIEELDKVAIEAIEKNMHIGFELMA